MCDCAVIVEHDRVLFAKNSDRDANEAQVLVWQPAQTHPAGARVSCTWIDIPQVSHTNAVLLSRPFWMWGAEMGANEHGLVIGNEAVFTRQPYGRSGLTGMDLLRLALERANSAQAAVETIVELIATHGQGGGCGHEHRSFTYHNSFLIADPTGALVLETADNQHAVEAVTRRRTISNALTIAPFAQAHSDRIKTQIACGRIRQRRTSHLLADTHDVAGMMRLLRDHGGQANGAPRSEPAAPQYRWLNGAMQAPCMHAGGRIAASQTTASWVAELSPTGVQHWVTATAAPCISLFKPVSVARPLDLGSDPTDCADDNSLWWRHERLHRRVMQDPSQLARHFTPQRDELEARWLREPPTPEEAFAAGDRHLTQWTNLVAAQAARDTRPRYVRHYWQVRNRRAGLSLPVATSS